MPRTRGEIQVFSLSFLDVLSCALGGILVLWFLTMDTSQKRAESYARQIDSMQKQIGSAQDALAASRKAANQAQQAAASAQSRADAQQQMIDGLKDAQGSLIGLNGKMEGAVFIFDTSASMEETRRFNEYKEMLKGWVKHLDFKRFNVIRFSSDVQAWKKAQLVDRAEANRNQACRFIDAFAPAGQTSTRAALEEAFSIPGVDTITLMSDGRPEPGGVAEMARIHAHLQKMNRDRRIIINCVAMGNYFGKDYAEFLQKIAHDHGGMFIGR